MVKQRTSAMSIVVVLVLAIILGYVIYSNFQRLEKELPVSADQVLNNAAVENRVILKSDKIIVLEDSEEAEVNDTNLETDDFSLNYPADWQVSQNQTDEIMSYDFLTGDNQEISLNIMFEAMQGLIEDSISVEEETTITVSGSTARKLKGGDLKDGSLIYSVLLVKNGVLYNLIARDEQILDQLLANFDFI